MALAGLAAAPRAHAQVAGPTVSQITQSVDEGQPTSAFSVAAAFQGNGCTIASPGPDVTVTGGTLDGGTVTAGATGLNVSYASNTGLAFGSFPVTLAFNYQCGVDAAVQTINDPNGLTLAIAQFAPGTTSIVVPENNTGTVIPAALLAPGRNYSTLTITKQPKNGKVVVGSGANPSVTYTPTANTFGADTFQYTLGQAGAVTGTNYASATGTVAVTVTQGLPVANAVSVTVAPNVATPIDVTANDLDGPFTAVTVTTPPTHGTASVNAKTLDIVYKPTAGYTGPDSLQYSVTNAVGRSRPATVTITVSTAAAVPASPNLSESTAIGQAVTFNATAQATGAPFTALAIVTRPAHGTATAALPNITYTPAAGFSGKDNFTFTLSNANGPSAPISVTVTVSSSLAPVAKTISTTTPKGTPVTIDVTQGATGGPFTSVQITQPPPAADGTARVQGLAIVFTPTPNFSGTATLLYTLSNAIGTSAPALLSITVSSVPAPNATPSALTLLQNQVDITRRFYEVQLGNFERHLEELHHGAHGFSLTVAGQPIGTQPAAQTNGAEAPAPAAEEPGGGGPSAGGEPGAAGGPRAQAAATTIGGDNGGGPSGSGEQGPAGGPRAQAATIGGDGGGGTTTGGSPAAGSSGQGAASGGGTSGGTGGPSSGGGTSPSGGGEAAAAGGGTQSASGGAQQAAGGGESTEAGAGASGQTASGSSQKNSTSASTPIELPDRLGLFASPIGNIGDKSAEFHHSGYDFGTAGFSLGADYRLNDWIVAGLGGGYTHDDDTLGSDGSRDVAHSFNLTGYGTIQATDQIYVDGILTWATLNFDSRRAAANGEFAYGNRDGTEAYGALTGGYEFDEGELTLAPYVRLNLATASLDPFVETGAGTASLTVGHETLTDFSSVIGFRGDYAISLEDGILSPHFRLEYLHEFLGGSHSSLDFADQPQGPFYKYATDPVNRNDFTIGVGGSYLTENAFSITFDFEELLGYRGETSHTFTFGATRRF